jgi:multisubunit Na+/H+ antiporter MnhB subunit
MTTVLRQVRTLVAAVWLGLVLTLATVAAPVLFAGLERAEAGRLAGNLFRIEAHVALGLAVVLFLVERRLAGLRARAGQGSALSANVLLVLGALFCTVLGYFALQPLMEAARAGQGRWSFGALHGVSSSLFALKGLLLLALVWRGAGTH